MNRTLKDSYKDWIAGTFGQKNALAFTLNFQQRCDGEWLSYDIAAATMRRYYRGLCRETFGTRRASRKDSPARLNFAAVKEGTPSRHRANTQLHYHGIIEVPNGMQLDEWRNVCQQQWMHLKWSDKHSYDFSTYQTSGFVQYMLKNRTKEDWQESLDLDTLCLAPPPSRYSGTRVLPFSEL